MMQVHASGKPLMWDTWQVWGVAQCLTLQLSSHLVPLLLQESIPTLFKFFTDVGSASRLETKELYVIEGLN